MKPKRKRPTALTVRSKIALSAIQRQGGAHGGSARAKNRRDRQKAKQRLREES